MAKTRCRRFPTVREVHASGRAPHQPILQPGTRVLATRLWGTWLKLGSRGRGLAAHLGVRSYMSSAWICEIEWSASACRLDDSFALRECQQSDKHRTSSVTVRPTVVDELSPQSGHRYMGTSSSAAAICQSERGRGKPTVAPQEGTRTPFLPGLCLLLLFFCSPVPLNLTFPWPARCCSSSRPIASTNLWYFSACLPSSGSSFSNPACRIDLSGSPHVASSHHR
ncbi:hypothetical protein VTI74DRAFT_6070 [Chaetomium olivicolor]